MRPQILSVYAALILSPFMMTMTAPSAAAESVKDTQLIANCLVCHNDHVQAIPDPRGFSSDTITKALLTFRDGSRDATIMNRIARGLNDEEIAILAQSLSHM